MIIQGRMLVNVHFVAAMDALPFGIWKNCTRKGVQNPLSYRGRVGTATDCFMELFSTGTLL